jgi:hypothetical protein
MHPLSKFILLPALLAGGLSPAALTKAAVPPKKPHVVVLGAVRQVPYSKVGDPAGAGPEETTLKIRALLVDGRVSEWTTGEAHDVTDRSFAVRRALRINDSLPSDSLPGGKSAESSNKSVRSRSIGSGSAVRGCWSIVLAAG